MGLKKLAFDDAFDLDKKNICKRSRGSRVQWFVAVLALIVLMTLRAICRHGETQLV